MQIDWKSLARTKGYKSLKAAYAHDIRKRWRNKEELQKLLKWVIGRAQHYAIRKGMTMEAVLNKWEEDRKQWWVGYYANYTQRKMHSNSLQPMGLNGIRKSHKRSSWLSAQKCKHRVCRDIQFAQKEASTKSPKRWTSVQKNRGYR